MPRTVCIPFVPGPPLVPAFFRAGRRLCLPRLFGTMHPAYLLTVTVQSCSMIMWAFGNFGLFVKPKLAESLTIKFHEGLVQGVDDPLGISSMVWALAYLGYAPPTPMLDHFKVTSLHGPPYTVAMDMSARHVYVHVLVTVITACVAFELEYINHCQGCQGAAVCRSVNEGLDILAEAKLDVYLKTGKIITYPLGGAVAVSKLSMDDDWCNMFLLLVTDIAQCHRTA